MERQVMQIGKLGAIREGWAWVGKVKWCLCKGIGE